MNRVLATLLSFACLLSLSLNPRHTDGAKILSITFMSSKSNKIVYEPLLHALAERGHEVTVVSPIKGTQEMKNLRNILTIEPEHFEKGLPNLFEMKARGSSKLGALLANPFRLLASWGLIETICRESYALPQVQAIMKEKFDLILFTPLFNECLYGLVHKLNTTTILISQVTIFAWVGASFGNPAPPSFVPSAFLGYSDEMTYIERLHNFFGAVYNHVIREYLYIPPLEKVYREFLGDASLPSVAEIEANASLVLCNSHVSFTKPKPLMPDIIDVGGMHLNPAKPLPKDLEDFFTGAGEQGFILFSMGSALKAHTMPERYRKLFLNTFAKLKQRVIWKWETEMEDVPKNVMVSKWLPQQDVLAHKNIRLFITHGGHGSTQEAIYHGVPLVGLPMFGDQIYNMEQAAKSGFALPLDFPTLTEEILLKDINKVLQSSSYGEKAKELSILFHDQIDKPLDRAVFWTEYVIRHKGARHLRSAGRNLTILQYYSVDVLAGIVAVILAFATLNFVVLRALVRKFCCRSKSTQRHAKSLSSQQKKTK